MRGKANGGCLCPRTAGHHPPAVIDYRNALYVGHLGPIPLYLHWTALLLVYMAWQWSGVGNDLYLLTVFVGVLAGSIVLHELGHGLTAIALAKHEAEKAMVIVLWAFGGVCIQQQREGHPWKEIAIVLAGPAVSLALWLGCMGTWAYLRQHHPEIVIKDLNDQVLYLQSLTIVGVLLVLGQTMNLALLVFNMLPIYPFDGGQAVHNGLKLMMKDYDLARKISFTISLLAAAAYVSWRFSLEQQLDFFLIGLIGFMLYNGYIALFVYRR